MVNAISLLTAVATRTVLLSQELHIKLKSLHLSTMKTGTGGKLIDYAIYCFS